MRNLVITIHGIRTFGNWQDVLAEALIRECAARTTKPPIVLTYRFGYFSAPALAVPLLRHREVRRFLEWLRGALRDHPDAKASIVAHSFGTFVAAHALRLLRDDDLQRIDTVLCAGSILPQEFAWDRLIGRNRVRRVVNDCGTQDSVLVLSQMFVLGGGIAGRQGFFGMHDNGGQGVFNRFFEFGHSGYFDPDPEQGHLRRYWVPVLLGDDPEKHDERETGVWEGIKATILQNLAASKALVYLALLGALAAAIYIPQQREANARLVESQFEAARQRVLAGRPDQALTALQSVLKLQPKHVAAGFLLPLVDEAASGSTTDPLRGSELSGDGHFQIGTNTSGSEGWPFSIRIASSGLSPNDDKAKALNDSLQACFSVMRDTGMPMLSYTGAAAFVYGNPSVLCDLKRSRPHVLQGGMSKVAFAQRADVVAVSHGPDVSVWSSRHDGLILKRSMSHPPRVLALDEDGRWLAVGFEDGKVLIIGLDGQAERTVTAMPMSAMQLKMSVVRARLLVCEMSPRPGSEAAEGTAEPHSICPLRSEADPDSGITNHLGALTTEVWDLSDTGVTRLSRQEFAASNGAALIGTGRYLAVSSASDGLAVYTAAGTKIARISDAPVQDLAMSGDGRTLAYIAGGLVHVVATMTGRAITVPFVAGGPRVRFSERDEHVISWQGPCTSAVGCTTLTKGKILIKASPTARSYASAEICADKSEKTSDPQRSAARLMSLGCALLTERPSTMINGGDSQPVQVDRLTRKLYRTVITTLKEERDDRPDSSHPYGQLHNAHVRIELFRGGKTVAETSIEVDGSVLGVAAAPDGRTFAALICELPKGSIVSSDCVFEILTWTKGQEAALTVRKASAEYAFDPSTTELIFDARSTRLIHIGVVTGVDEDDDTGRAAMFQYTVSSATEPRELRTLMTGTFLSIGDARFGMWIMGNRRSIVTVSQADDAGESPALGVLDLASGQRLLSLEDSAAAYPVLVGNENDEWLLGADRRTGAAVWEMRSGRKLWLIGPAKYGLPDVSRPLSSELEDDAGEASLADGIDTPCHGYSDVDVGVKLSDDGSAVALRCRDVIDVFSLRP